MFGMGTGGSLRLLSPERSGAPAICCRASSLRRFGHRTASRLPCERFAFASAALAFAPSKPHRLEFRSRLTKAFALLLRHSSTNLFFRGLGFRVCSGSRFRVPRFPFGSAPLLLFPIPYSLLPLLQDQALDRLVSSSSIRYRTSTDDLSTLSSSRGLTHF